MATTTIALGANINTVLQAGAAGDTFNFAAGIYYGQTWNAKANQRLIGSANGTFLSGASLITSWTNVSANWYKATQGRVDVQATVTVTSASPGVVTWTGSTFADGQPIAITTTGAMPTGLTAGTTYYVKSPSGATFNLAATVGGAAINTSSTGSGLTGNAAGGGALTNFPTPKCLARFTGSISGTTLTVASTQSGTVSSTGSNVIYGNGVTAATYMVSGAGPFTITPSQTVAASTSMLLIDTYAENPANGAFPVNPMAYWNEELFVDDVKYTRIQCAATPAAPGAGQWYYNLADNSVNINLASPTSHRIEYSQVNNMTANAGGAGVLMKGLTVEKYSTNIGQGAVDAPDSWTYVDMTARLNHGAGIQLANGNGPSYVVRGHYIDNGGNGITGSVYGHPASSILGADISRNNINMFSSGWQGGGIKVTGASELTIASNTVNDNGGPGIWCDIDCSNITIDGNTCLRNVGPGIMYEISFGPSGIINNTVLQAAASDQCCIFISNAQGLEVARNNVTVGLGNNGARIGGGICVLNVARQSRNAFTNVFSFTGSIAGTTLTISAITGTPFAGGSGGWTIRGNGIRDILYLNGNLTGSGGVGTYALTRGCPPVGSETMVAFVGNSGCLHECRDVWVHENTITYQSTAGNAMDGLGIDQAIVGGSNIVFDYNTYYTPNSTGTRWNWSTDAGTDTTYTWAAYQAAGFEPNSTNIVGVPPATPPSGSFYSGQRTMFGPVTIVGLDVSTVTTDGTAVDAFSAGHCTAGGRIQNPGPTYLGIRQDGGTASGTFTNGATIFIPPGWTRWLIASPNKVSVISSDSAHVFAGEGWQ